MYAFLTAFIAVKVNLLVYSKRRTPMIVCGKLCEFIGARITVVVTRRFTDAGWLYRPSRVQNVLVPVDCDNLLAAVGAACDRRPERLHIRIPRHFPVPSWPPRRRGSSRTAFLIIAFILNCVKEISVTKKCVHLAYFNVISN